ncbi:NAD(P)/FAD-dependent oxidoreductase [Amphritea sp. HPY]|uniref:NAD(P)/FAD-dependent oxidoreductase n=1 Tax=Amphritea sp. HPY TaxID=3421652 RepID=UPI003D7E2A52
MSHVVIIGGGHAGSQLISSLRQHKFSGRITLIADEKALPYNRPSLSKDFLSGEKTEHQIALLPDAVFASDNINCMLNTTVTQLNPNSNSIRLSDGSNLNYDYLVIATGSVPRQLDIPGSDLKGIHYLKTLNDAKNLQADIKNANKMVVVGGGYIGLEIAATARKKGLDVTILEMAPRILQRVVAPEVSDFFMRIHTEQDVNIVTNISAQAFKGRSHVKQVVASDGQSFNADIVVIGVGVIPNDALAHAAGLVCDNGILVNEYCQTTQDNIFATGDCTNHFNQVYGRRVRLESVQNAVDQAKTIASCIVGNKKAYNSIPWFWSSQYNLKLQIAGLSQGYDQLVIRGDATSDSVSFFYLKERRVIACDAVNQVSDFMSSKKLIERKIIVDPAQLISTEVAIKSLIE